jgi:hypothetical protein
MTAPTITHRDASRIKLASSIGESCPDLCADEVAVLGQIRAAGGYVSPSRLHAMYTRLRAAADLEWDEPLRHTRIHGHQSHPVDATVGEPAVDQIMGRSP